MVITTTTIDDNTKRALSIWKTCLTTASRTTFACVLVAILTLYGPTTLRHYVQFPAFSYVALILVMTNSSLGDGIRGCCWFAVCATLQTVVPAILIFTLIGPLSRLTPISISLLLGAHAFFVALPEWSHTVTKRVGLGQLVILYVVGFINGDETKPVMHPVHVAASTAVGVVASVLGLLLPYPQLAASHEVKNCKLYVENVSQRVKVLVKAFCCGHYHQDMKTSESLISQAKSLTALGSQYLLTIKSKQEGIQWERFMMMIPSIIRRQPFHINHEAGDKFQNLQTLLQGMEMVLLNNYSSTSPVSSSISTEAVQNQVNRLEDTITHNLHQMLNYHQYLLSCSSSSSCSCSCSSSIGDDVDSNNKTNNNNNFFLQTIQQQPMIIIPPKPEDISSYSFLFCLKLLHLQSSSSSSTSSKPPNPLPLHNNNTDPPTKHSSSSSIISKSLTFINSSEITPTTHTLIHTSKFSLSLTLAVLLGLLYSTPDGFWAGLPVAITFTSLSTSSPTFTSANVKAQGTVLGTVYAVIICFTFRNLFFQLRLVSLLPWFVFTAFLQRGSTRFYGQAGGVSAIIGAVLILGRKNFGPANEFAIVRIVETFIGLGCSVAVDLLMQPKRGSSLAKTKLIHVVGMLGECVLSVMNVQTKSEGTTAVIISGLKREVMKLKDLIVEAESEPNFWFLPFHVGCYNRMLCSLSNMVVLLTFTSMTVNEVTQMQRRLLQGDDHDGLILDGVNEDMERFNKVIGKHIKCFESVMSVKSLPSLDKMQVKCSSSTMRKSGDDLEMGEVEDNSTSSSRRKRRSSSSGDDFEMGEIEDNSSASSCSVNEDDDNMENILSQFLDHVSEVAEKLMAEEQEEEEDGEDKAMKAEMMMLSLGALGFCMVRLVAEIKEFEKEVRELLQWENPTSQVKLDEIYEQVIALSS